MQMSGSSEVAPREITNRRRGTLASYLLGQQIRVACLMLLSPACWAQAPIIFSSRRPGTICIYSFSRGPSISLLHLGQFTKPLDMDERGLRLVKKEDYI